MRTQEFIDKNFGVKQSQDRFNSSVMVDTDGNIYSYGYHYPLLIQVGNATFRNVSGYSNTTRKHIGWCWNHNAIDVELDREAISAFNRRDRGTIRKIRNCLLVQAYEIDKQMKSKKRKDTKVYADLESQLTRIECDLEKF